MKPVLTYPLSDRQVIFDHVWHHFVTKGNPLGLKDGACVYDTATGGCVIGCLLPADFRKQIGQSNFGITNVWSDEGVHSRDAAPFRARFEKLFSPSVHGFLSALQSAHDSAALDGRGIEEQLRRLAGRHGLTIPEKPSWPAPKAAQARAALSAST